MTAQEFYVGDIVKVVDKPVKCAFTWVPSMSAFCGKEYKISLAKWSTDKGCWRYNIRSIGGGFVDDWNWDAKCFEIASSDFEVSDESGMKDLFGLI